MHEYKTHIYEREGHISNNVHNRYFKPVSPVMT